jgi:AcrR family transcriptional regulator
MGNPSTRDRIVLGAMAVFTDQGIADATVQDVLERAEVSRRTFYQYFQGKEDVLRAVYDLRVDRLVAALGAGIQRPGDPMDKVVAALDAWITLQIEGGRLFVELQSEASRPASLLHPRRERTVDAIVATIDGAVRAAGGRAVDPLVYRGLVLGVEGLALHQVERQALVSERERFREAVAALVLVVLRSSRDLPDPPASDSARTE